MLAVGGTCPMILFFDYCTLGTMNVSKFGGVVVRSSD